MRIGVLTWVGAMGLTAGLCSGPLGWLGSAPQGPPPRGAEVPEFPDPPESSIALPVRIPLKIMERQLEQGLGTELVRRKAEPLDHGFLMDLTATREGSVQVLGLENEIRVSFPMAVEGLAYTTGAATRAERNGKSSPHGVGLSLRAQVNTSVVPSIDESWNLTSTSTVTLDWITPPKVSIGPVSLPLGNVLDRAFEPALKSVAQQVDAQLTERAQLRRTVRRTWKELHTPMALSTDPEVWLVVEPTALVASELDIRQRAVTLTAGVLGRFRTVLGEEPEAVEPPDLPPRQPPPESEGLSVHLPIVLPWEPLSATVTRSLADQQWSDPNTGVTLVATHATLYPSGTAVVVALDVDVSLGGQTSSGQLFLTTRPVVDLDAAQFRLEDVEVQFATGNLALSAAQAWVGSALAVVLEDRLTLPVSEPLDAMRQEVNSALAQTASSQADVTGALDNLVLLGVWVADEGMLIGVHAQGALEVVAKPESESNGPPSLEPQPSRRSPGRAQ